jgi:hypothetical protein
MRNKKRKKYQNQLNKKIKTLNKNLAEDKIFKGRFVMKQIEAEWEQYYDYKNGRTYDAKEGQIFAIIRMYDKKTQLFKDYSLEYAEWRIGVDWKLCVEIANDFVCEIRTRKREDYINEEEIDWTKVPLEKIKFHYLYEFYNE